MGSRGGRGSYTPWCEKTLPASAAPPPGSWYSLFFFFLSFLLPKSTKVGVGTISQGPKSIPGPAAPDQPSQFQHLVKKPNSCPFAIGLSRAGVGVYPKVRTFCPHRPRPRQAAGTADHPPGKGRGSRRDRRFVSRRTWLRVPHPSTAS